MVIVICRIVVDYKFGVGGSGFFGGFLFEGYFVGLGVWRGVGYNLGS